MTTKAFARLCLFLTIVFLLIGQTVNADRQAAIDSVNKLIPTLDGEPRLQALTDLHSLIASGSDAGAELKSLRRIIAEAHRQGAAGFEGMTRVRMVMCYYNYDMADSLMLTLPTHLMFMAKHEQWDYYYNSWNTKIEQLIYEGKIQTALQDARMMYDDAKVRNINYGLGVSADALGSIYQTMQRYDLSEKSFYEAVALLKKEEDVSLLLTTYNKLCEVLDANNRHAEILTVAAEWKKTIDNYKLNAEKKGFSPVLNGRYLMSYLALATGNLYTDNIEQATHFMNLADENAKGRKAISQLKLLQFKTRYFEYLQQFDKALVYADSNYNMLQQFGDYVSAVSVLENKANILRQAGRGADAADIYVDVMTSKDSLRNLEMAAQLDELRTIYEVDRLVLEKKVSETRILILVVVSLLLVVMFAGYIVYTIRLNRKNRILFDKIRNQQQCDTKAQKVLEKVPDEELTKEQVLFRSLNALLAEKQLFIDSAIGRKELADMLGTNVTYLADAIKTCSQGMTVGEYLNRVRLVYAGNILVENPNLPVDAVGEDAGFSSRSTYYRLFRDYYGMTPNEFRNISKKKIKV